MKYGPFGSRLRTSAALVATATALIVIAPRASLAQATLSVSDSSSFGAAIATINSNPSVDYILNFTANVTMSAQVQPIVTNGNVTVHGNGAILDGSAAYRPFFISSGNVRLENLSITNAFAQGGRGSDGAGSGGGGLGAGAAVFVDSGGRLTVQNVNFVSNTAKGGNGGNGFGTGGGGGGGMGGGGGDQGGFGIAASGGGGGLYGNGGNAGGAASGGGGGTLGSGGNAALNGGGGGGGGSTTASGGDGSAGAAGAGGTPGGNGGHNASDGAPGTAPGGGGGGSGTSPSAGGAGAKFGGGGGGSSIGGAGGDFAAGGGGTTIGGAGGFGGGGGGAGNGSAGNGGFGAGGGAGLDNAAGQGGFGGGSGTATNMDLGGGGGGAGFGGAIFVKQGGQITFADAAGFAGNTAQNGLGGISFNGYFIAADGAQDGNDLFMMRGTSIGFDISNGQTLSFAPVIGNADGTANAGVTLTKSGAGTLALSTANLYDGGTTISSGTVVVGDNSALGTGLVSMATGSSLGFAMSDFTLANNFQISGDASFVPPTGTTQTIAGVISDGGTPGVLQVNGAGTLVFSGVNTYTGGTIVDAGTLQLSGAGTLGAASGATTVNGGTLDLGTTTQIQNGGVTLASGTIQNGVLSSSNGFALQSGTASAVLAGSGAASKTTSGTVSLTGANTYSGGTVVTSGTLQLSGAGTLGAASGATTVNGGTLDLGTTTQIQNGGVTLAGGTIQNGVLSSSNGFALQSGIASAVLAGSGGVTKTTLGTVSLTGANTYTGATNVNAGTLSVDGSIASSAVTVNAGGTLGGTGIVGATTINGGTLSPGNSIGTLTVQGSLVMTSAATYLVEVSPSTADRTNVIGTATLGGATVNATFAAGAYVARQYTIVNATGGVSGSFGAIVNSNLPSGFTSSLGYDANNAYLNLALAFSPAFGGLNSNQQAVTNTLVNFFNTTGGIPLVFGTLTPAGLTQVSGGPSTASQQTTFDAMNQFMGVMTDPFTAGRGDPIGAGGNPNAYADEALAYAARRKPNDALAAIYSKTPPMAPAFEQRWSTWAAGFGGSQTTSGDPVVLGSNNTRSSVYGVAVGADYRLSPNTLAGFALAGGGTSFSVTNSLGSGRSDLFQAGGFIRHNFGPAYLTGALAYGWQDITVDRTVTVAGIDRLRAQFNANAWSGRAEGGYRFVSHGFGWTPYAAGQFTTFELPDYAEQVISGANTFALAYAARSVTDTRSELGLRTDKSYAVENGIFTLRGRAAWAHDFNRDRLVGATFQTLPGASFVVNGAQRAADAALVTGSAEMKWLNGWSVAGTFEGEFSSVTQSYAGKGVLRRSW